MRISVGSGPPVFRARAIWMDGQAGAAAPVEIGLDDAAQELVIGDHARWPFAQIRQLRDQAGGDQVVLRRADDPVARLVVPSGDDARVIRSRARRIDRVPRASGLRRIAAWAVAALASVALIVFLLVPALADRLAAFLPPEGEKALGDATLHQVRQALSEDFDPLRICDAPGGQAALESIGTRLAAGANLPVPLTVHVLDHELVNAFALPGGYIVFFDGLLQEAGGPEEVAAVFAHEMGHVENRDPTRIALRSAGSIGVLGLLLGDFAGGALVLFLTNQLIQADYTREAEAGADTYAHALLLKAGMPPEGIATFFERLSSDAGEPTGLERHFMSHPALGDRVAAARAATPEGATFAPVLSDAEWRALRGICTD
ncbi:M48 family metallopeptidase [Roseisalinus antarcticus]|nr:M48 family metallopeptidase [Roseisalinus antarcticus]